MWTGKGSRPRPSSISKEEKDLRHELIYAKPERKEEIKRILEDMKNGKT